jgi:hypothetical protein
MMEFRFQIRADQTGPIQEVIKRLAADMIEKSALMQFRATSVDKPSGYTFDITNGELLGGKIIKLEPSRFSQAVISNSVTVRFL